MAAPPLVALSPNLFHPEARRFYPGKSLEYGEESLAAAVREVGGLPLLACRAGAGGDALEAHAASLMQRCMGLLLSGGADVAPASYGDAPEREAWAGDPARDRWEIALYRAARAARRPILGVCRGLQLMNVAEGGTLWQDLTTLREGSLQHRDQDVYDRLDHGLEVEPGTWLSHQVGGGLRKVNTVHHQGIRQLGGGFAPMAWAPDGLIEAIAHRDGSFCIGVQWHPEWMAGEPLQRKLFARFVEAAAAGDP